MKYIIPQDKVDKIVFRYLDNTLKNLEKGKPKYFKGIVFAYPNEEFGILGWDTDGTFDGTLYIYEELIDEISNGFGLNRNNSKSIIGRWVRDRYQLEAKNIIAKAFNTSLQASDRY